MSMSDWEEAGLPPLTQRSPPPQAPTSPTCTRCGRRVAQLEPLFCDTSRQTTSCVACVTRLWGDCTRVVVDGAHVLFRGDTEVSNFDGIGFVCRDADEPDDARAATTFPCGVCRRSVVLNPPSALQAQKAQAGGPDTEGAPDPDRSSTAQQIWQHIESSCPAIPPDRTHTRRAPSSSSGLGALRVPHATAITTTPSARAHSM